MAKVKKTKTQERIEFLGKCLEKGMSRPTAAAELCKKDKKVSKGYAVTLVYSYFSGERYAVPYKPKPKKKKVAPKPKTKVRTSRNPKSRAKPAPRSKKVNREPSMLRKAKAEITGTTKKVKPAPKRRKTRVKADEDELIL